MQYIEQIFGSKMHIMSMVIDMYQERIEARIRYFDAMEFQKWSWLRN